MATKDKKKNTKTQKGEKKGKPKLTPEEKRAQLRQERLAELEQQTQQDESRATDRASQFYSSGSLGRFSEDPETARQSREAIDLRRQAYDRSMQMDPDVAGALGEYRNRMGGYTPAEMQAMREQGNAGINESQARAQRDIRRSAGAMGYDGGIAMGARMDIAKQSSLARQRNEQELIRQNAMEKSKRLGDYANFAQTVSNQQFQNQNAALNNYNADVFGNRQFQAQAQQFNLGQEEKEKAGYLGTFYGDQGTSVARRDALDRQLLGEEAMDIARKQKLKV